MIFDEIRSFQVLIMTCRDLLEIPFRGWVILFTGDTFNVGGEDIHLTDSLHGNIQVIFNQKFTVRKGRAGRCIYQDTKQLKIKNF